MEWDIRALKARDFAFFIQVNYNTNLTNVQKQRRGKTFYLKKSEYIHVYNNENISSSYHPSLGKQTDLKAPRSLVGVQAIQ